MKIGLMADTHDRLDAIKKAVEFFNRVGVEHVLHAGDLVSPFTAREFSALKAKLHVVWGNNDGDKEFLRTKFGEIGARLLGDFAELKFADRKIALLHGTNQDLVDALAGSELFDVVVRGHTHEAGLIEAQTLVVNPGEVCGYLSGRQTAAVLDLVALEAEIIEL
ncbi:MAG: metallophosphoesterase [Candidatus Hodarchaeaceae archaeon]|nr:metallophosphoesterase [Candidatus Hodarchaeaceae archaeon]